MLLIKISLNLVKLSVECIGNMTALVGVEDTNLSAARIATVNTHTVTIICVGVVLIHAANATSFFMCRTAVLTVSKTMRSMLSKNNSSSLFISCSY